MAQNKTVETTRSVTAFLKTIKDEKKRNDCAAIIKLVPEHTGLEPKMWGTAIVGFGTYHYTYESGREGDAPLFGLAARVNAIVLYLSPDFDTRTSLLAKFGKHKTSKACVYIQKLEDIDTDILIKLVKDSIADTRKKYPG
jgi:hypothetical protein